MMDYALNPLSRRREVCCTAYSRLTFVSQHPSFLSGRPSSRMNNVQTCRKNSIAASTSRSTSGMHMSSPPGRSYHSPTRGGRARQQTRNRGANAANHNRRGHELRLTGHARTRPKKARRAPRWEREGDGLYAQVTTQMDGCEKRIEAGQVSERLLALASERIATAEDVHRALSPWTAADDGRSQRAEGMTEPETTDEKIVREQPNKSSPFLWGTLPVGPVLASRLHASRLSAPTSVQRAAFPILTAGHGKGKNKKKTNAIIASPTGTGKTLAYLLPLLCTSPGGQAGEGTGGVLIVSPTIELAVQIQRDVDVLWPPISKNGTRSGTCRSSCFVVGADEEDNSNDVDDDDESIMPGRISLRSIQHAPIIAGTPKMLRMLYREAKRIANNPDNTAITHQECATSKALLSNLRAIVLDEADRLLRTEAASREAAERKAYKIAHKRAEEAATLALEEYLPPLSPGKKKRPIIARQTQTELLLRDLPLPSLDDVQVVCASATVGRTMRRQLMQILDRPSADAAATLVTGDEDERAKSKDAKRRRGALLPGRLRHAYRVVADEETCEGVDEEEFFNGRMSIAERNEERRTRSTLNALWDTMTSMDEAKPIIIFPGRVGVERIQNELLARGLRDVRTLGNLDGTSPETDLGTSNAKMEADSETPPDVKTLAGGGDGCGWDGTRGRSIPVYIIGERFARGLDLPDISRVVLLSPPSSAAGYAHMAGRTGRVGREGMAITLVRPRRNGGEVRRLAAIAEALGLRFDASVSGGSEAREIAEDGKNSSGMLPQSEQASLSTTSHPWVLLSEPALKRKKKAELHQYLISFGDETTTMNISKRSKKADLVSAIQLLHSNID